MNVISVTNPRYANAAQTLINADVNFEGIGAVSFTASPNDSEVHGRTVFAGLISGSYGPIAAFIGPTLAQAQVTQITTLEAAYTATIQLPVAYMATTFQADSSSQDVLAKCLVAGSVPAGFYWLDATNAQVQMTFAQLQGLAGAMLVQGQTAFVKLQTKKTAVRDAATVAAVQAVVW